MMLAAPPPTTATDPAPGLPEPPRLPDARALAMFKLLNRWFMVPAVRAGLGPWVSSPLGGYMVLLRVRGRTSGLVRETPLNYVLADGSAWVLAGFGPRTEWYRNLLADPDVEVVLPGRAPLAATAAEVTSPAVRTRIIPVILRSTVGPSMAAGVNPFAGTDQDVAVEMAWVPLVRLTPLDEPLEPGPDDPGGRAWVWRQALVFGTALLVAGMLLRAAARLGR